jgi:four helix bundle protein
LRCQCGCNIEIAIVPFVEIRLARPQKVVRRPGEPASQRKEMTMTLFDVAPYTTARTTSAPYLAVEKLDCYRVALEFQTLVARVHAKRHRELRDQLKRASLSIVLNLAEGAGRSSGSDKARFYAIARGSAVECAAIFDVVRSLGLEAIDDCIAARNKLIRIVRMITKLEASARELHNPRNERDTFHATR